MNNELFTLEQLRKVYFGEIKDYLDNNCEEDIIIYSLNKGFKNIIDCNSQSITIINNINDNELSNITKHSDVSFRRINGYIIGVNVIDKIPNFWYIKESDINNLNEPEIKENITDKYYNELSILYDHYINTLLDIKENINMLNNILKELKK